MKTKIFFQQKFLLMLYFNIWGSEHPEVSESLTPVQ